MFSISAKYYCVDRHDHRLAANRFPKVNRTSAASIEKPIHNVKVPMNDAEAPFKTCPKAGTVVFISGIFVSFRRQAAKSDWWSLSGSNR
ncbi:MULTISPECIES: hypothetical protein [unclassified Sphingopyxis]|uniref:hypothetical protein n=1 Tax=unclassified Sphingopyxis TaxID=2614943 RepID=UPI0012E335F8|nr:MULTISPECIES: hypothetical protein [unclassified Sphingopyxis]